MSRALRRVTLDWKDALLFGFGFAGAIAAATLFPEAHEPLSHFAVAIALVPSLVRRRLFGPVIPPRTRRGALWSMVSMLGLLLVLAGAGGLTIAALRGDPREAPDFEADARAMQARIDADLAPLAALTGDTPTDAEREAGIRRRAADARAAWAAERDRHRAKSLRIAGGAFGLLLAGALLVRLRQQPAP
ncbi:MAG: hypothetical protein H6704_19790 [Myxococcales bacterium]|nr:hypothetical protein [Myxococcales bacterium]